MKSIVKLFEVVGDALRDVGARQIAKRDEFLEWKDTLAASRDVIPEDKIVLTNSFTHKAVPILTQHSSGMNIIPRNMFDPYRFSPYQKYEVPLSYRMSEEAKAQLMTLRIDILEPNDVTPSSILLRNIKWVDEEIEDLIAKNKKAGEAIDQFYWGEEVVDQKTYRQRRINNVLDKLTKPAFMMEDFGAYLRSRRFDRIEDRAICSGKGDVMLKFWQAMHALPAIHIPNDHFNGGDSKLKKELLERSTSTLKPTTLQA